MKKNIKQFSLQFVFIVLFCLSNTCANADFLVIQSLSFGEFIVRDNDIKQTINVNTDGSYGFSNSFIEIAGPRPGIYDIGDLPPNTAISINITQIQPMTGNNNFFTYTIFYKINQTHTQPKMDQNDTIDPIITIIQNEKNWIKKAKMIQLLQYYKIKKTGSKRPK